MTTDDADALKAVEEAARAARGTVADLAGVPDERLDEALRGIAGALGRAAGAVLAANEADMTAARADGLGGGVLGRLRPGQAPPRRPPPPPPPRARGPRPPAPAPRARAP